MPGPNDGSSTRATAGEPAVDVVDLTDARQTITGSPAPAVHDFVLGERLRWRGHRFEVVDVAPLTPSHIQLVLHDLDRPGPPVSVPASDLTDAVFEPPAGS